MSNSETGRRGVGIFCGVAAVALLALGYTTGKRAGISEGEERAASRGGSSATAGAAADGGDAQRKVVSALGRSLKAPSNPHALVVELGQTGDRNERLEKFLALASSLRADEFRDVIDAYIVAGTWRKQSAELGILMQGWAEVDPEAAVKFISGRFLPESVKASVLSAWAKASPDEALAYARKHYMSTWFPTNELLVGVINGLGESDPDRAVELISELPGGQPRFEALRPTVMAVMDGGIESAIAWCDGIADEGVRSDVAKLMVHNVAAHDPERAAELIQSMQGLPGAEQAADRVAHSFALNDLDRAMEWSRELDGKPRLFAARGVILALGGEDPRRAGEYLETMRGTTDLSFAARTLAIAASETEPELAMRWVGDVSEPAEQRRLYRQIVELWANRDREEASRWVTENGGELPQGILNGVIDTSP